VNRPLPLAPAPARATTLSTDVYRQLRADLLSGRLQPGEKLPADALRQRFGVACSPIREALNRLVSEGFVQLADQKGFRVAPVSEQELRELVEARCWIDGSALRQAIARHDAGWEESLVLALHRLARVERHPSAEPDEARAEWERLHREFHGTLVAGCGNERIARISAQLFDSAERYRLLAADRIPEACELGEHSALVNACLGRHVDEAVRVLETHYGRSIEVFMAAPAGAARLT
jgi:GntR family transcriptional regulator, carbon starvation induced regulator